MKYEVGDVLGIALGLELGEREGLSDGDAEGDPLGDTDGLALGDTDGLPDGDVLGLALGELEGLADGLTVGASTVHVPSAAAAEQLVDAPAHDLDPAQSECSQQAASVSQGGHSSPPQSTSVSLPPLA